MEALVRTERNGSCRAMNGDVLDAAAAGVLARFGYWCCDCTLHHHNDDGGGGEYKEESVVDGSADENGTERNGSCRAKNGDALDAAAAAAGVLARFGGWWWWDLPGPRHPPLVVSIIRIARLSAYVLHVWRQRLVERQGNAIVFYCSQSVSQ